ncbi:DNA sulfur modification protein DndB [Paenibacillus odorifer]|uniref:DNA sulfur modification protein DndB n=1 Tax=Paenibacillus odorifer TaxID=189426 RepID=UPI00096DEE1B|nr:DNA sulfur modification protein DndB [Paenibacillus odorifer]OMD66776.1 hypothetical protein BSK50_30640 [Paenibacillus odorifer]
MKRDRTELEENLLNVINETKNSKKTVLEINKNMIKYGVPIGTYESIYRGDTSISVIDLPLLCVLTESVYKVTGDNRINTTDYFSEKEIANSEKVVASHEYSEDDIIELPIVFENVLMLELDNYVTKVDLSYLVDMSTSQLIYYDPETQRGLQYRKKGEGVIEIPIVNKKSVQNISEHMDNKDYFADMITLNAFSTEVEPITYNEKTKTLTINKGVTISILDGFHRLQAGVRSKSINPEFSQPMILSIRSYDEDTAKKYFGQINTINVLKKERKEELKSEKNSDVTVRNFMRKSKFKNKIASASAISEIAGQLTTFSIMSYAVEKTFNPINLMEATEIADYMVDFFNYLTGYYVEEFDKNPNKYRDTYINHQLSFIGFIIIAKYFRDNNIPLRELKSFVDKINFQEEVLVDLLTDKRGINSSRVRMNVLQYFEKVVGGVELGVK